MIALRCASLPGACRLAPATDRSALPAAMGSIANRYFELGPAGVHCREGFGCPKERAVHHSLGRFGAETPTPAWTTRVEPTLKETNRHSPVSARRDRANPIGVLKAKYPVVCRLVTEPSFRLAARCYIVADPSDIPIAHSYGDDFPRFLRSRSSLACVEYVAGVAELEMLRHKARYAPHAQPLAAVALSSLQAEKLAGLRV